MSPDQTLGVAVVEDHPLYRDALERALREVPSVTVLSASRSVEDLYRTLAAGGDGRPEVVLLDLHLPGVSGAQAVSRLCGDGFAVLVLSAVDDPAPVLEAIAAGAAGYLTKSADIEEITAAVTRVGKGGTYISPDLASYLLLAAGGQPRRPQGPPANAGTASGVKIVATLTERERAILSLVAAGERDVDIAARLLITVSTVRSHLDRIRHKTGHRRRPDLTRLAYEAGLTPDPRPDPDSTS
jgi:DNA-binding NarL/FixJ family response regulator